MALNEQNTTNGHINTGATQRRPRRPYDSCLLQRVSRNCRVLTCLYFWLNYMPYNNFCHLFTRKLSSISVETCTPGPPRNVSKHSYPAHVKASVALETVSTGISVQPNNRRLIQAVMILISGLRANLIEHSRTKKYGYQTNIQIMKFTCFRHTLNHKKINLPSPVYLRRHLVSEPSLSIAQSLV
jgi:hypothetical protein